VDALRKFISDILSRRPRAKNFISLIDEFTRPVAFFGAINSLAQTTLKLTAPGNPDIYQGTELWDLSLVDPDNRRPVDFELRRKLLSELRTSVDWPELGRNLMSGFEDGRIKMWVIMRGLEFRREHPELFRTGSYVRLETANASQHVCAFARVREDKPHARVAIVAVPRFSYTLMSGVPQAPLGEVWGELAINLPEASPLEFENIFTGERVQAKDGRLLCREIFSAFPVCVLSALDRR